MRTILALAAVVLAASVVVGEVVRVHHYGARNGKGIRSMGPVPKPKSSAPPAPVFPTTYIVEAVVELPYAAISQPVTYYYDAPNGLMREDYYGGLNSYSYNVSSNMTYQVMPMGNASMGCLYIPGPVQLISIFPDITPFTFKDNEACPDQATETCAAWQYVQTVEQKTNTYTLWIGADGTPQHYEMMGYDRSRLAAALHAHGPTLHALRKAHCLLLLCCCVSVRVCVQSVWFSL
jgi:hypothetical protein